jgi:hypothetical protein
VIANDKTNEAGPKSVSSQLEQSLNGLKYKLQKNEAADKALNILKVVSN